MRPDLRDRIAALPPDKRAILEARLGGDAAGRPSRAALPSRDPDGPRRLSFAQESFWIRQQMQPDSARDNLLVGVRVTGTVDEQALAASVRKLVTQHEVLRTVVTETVDGPRAEVLPIDAITLSRTAPPAGPADTQLADVIAQESRHVFDLARGPLLRVRLATLGQRDQALLICMHHLIGDADSIRMVVGELIEGYVEAAGGRATPPRVAGRQYYDYASWQRSAVDEARLASHVAFWKDQLDGVPTLQLPTRGPAAARGDHSEGGFVQRTIDAAAAQALRSLAARHGGSLFCTVLAALVVTLSRYGQADRIAVSTPMSGRARPELERMIGCFANTVVLHGEVARDPTFAELVRQLGARVAAVHDHQDIGVEQHAYGQVMLLVDEEEPLPEVTADVAELHIADLRIARESMAKRPLTVMVTSQGDALSLGFGYATDSIDPGVVPDMLDHLVGVLARATREPDAAVSRLGALDAAQHQRVVVDWNDSGPGHRAGPVHEAFVRQAARTPGAVAVLDGRQQLTFAELDRASSRVAQALVEVGVGPETPVAVCLERECALVVAVLGVHKAGGAFVPVDPRSPTERTRRILSAAGAAVVVATPDCTGSLPGGLTIVDPVAVAAAAGHAAAAPGVTVHPEQTAYILFTSGSTGEPKGVAVEHRQLDSYVRGVTARLGLQPAGSYAMVQPLTVDSCMTMLYPPLIGGGTLHLISAERAADAGALSRYMDLHRIDYLKIAPSHLSMLEGSLSAGSVLGHDATIVGGEACHWDLLDRLRAKRRGRLVVHYGPTETTVGVLTQLVPAHGALLRGGVPIGRPLPGTRCYILGRDLEPVPVGVAGDLYAAGDHLARGYLGRPGATAAAFIPSPYGVPGERLYRTGDQARYGPQGAIEFLGRADGQVKIRGHRVELGEIEMALREDGRVLDAVAVVQRRGANEQLNAFVTVAATAGARADELERHLATGLLAVLPAHMVPSRISVLDTLPRTPHGKLDRSALPQVAARAPGRDHRARTPTQAAIASAFAEALEVDDLADDDDFLALGGNSLTAIGLLSGLRETLDVKLTLRILFEHPTVASLAAAVADLERPHAGELADRPSGSTPRDDGDPRRMSMAQQRLWFLQRLSPADPSYHLPFALRLGVPVSVEQLDAALQAVLRRHEVLRSVVTLVDDVPWSTPVAPAPRLVETLALAHDDDRTLARALEAYATKPFDLATQIPVRAVAFTQDGRPAVLAVVLHHIAADGASLGILVRDLARALQQSLGGGPADLDGSAPQYADFADRQARWLDGDQFAAELGYWRKRLSGPLPALDLGSARPARRSGRGATVSLPIDDVTYRGLTALARASDATLFMALLTTVQVLLHRLSGQSDIIVGTPVAGRARPDRDTVGCFVNTLALRVDLGDDPDLRTLLRRVRDTTIDDFSHRDVPFDRLVDDLALPRDLGRHPLFQVAVSLAERDPLDDTLPGLEPLPVGTPTAKFDLTAAFATGAGGLELTWEYSTDLFDRSAVERLGASFLALAHHAIESPTTPVSRLRLAPGGVPVRGRSPAPAVPDAGETVHRAPASDLERRLCGIFGDVLQQPCSSTEQSFFAMGGHSLLAVKLVGRIAAVLGIDLPLSVVFECPTVSGLAAHLEGSPDLMVASPGIEPVASEALVDLSFAQLRLWFLHQLDPTSTAYHLHGRWRLRGPLDTERLARAVDTIVARHEPLRTSFPLLPGGDRPIQHVAPPRRGHLAVRDGALAADDPESWAAHAADATAGQPFDLAAGPLFRAELFRLGAQEHRLCLTAHHTAVDGWSLSLLTAELAQLYRRPAEPLPPLPVQYRDYSAWQRGRLGAADSQSLRDYWLGSLAGAPPRLTIPPTAGATRDDATGQRVSARLTAAQSQQIGALLGRHDATVFMGFLAALAAVLSRWSGQHDIVIGAPIAARPRPELEGLIGFFANTIALRIDVGGDPTFAQLLAHTRERALGGYAHQEMPFEWLVDEMGAPRDTSSTPVFQVMLNVLNIPRGQLTLDGVEVSAEAVESPSSKFDISVYVVEEHDGVQLELVHSPGRHSAADMQALLDQVVALLLHAAQDPERPLSACRDHHQPPGPTGSDPPPGNRLHERVAAVAVERPDHVAVVAAGRALTYRELDDAANHLAGDLGVACRKGDVVGLVIGRRTELAVGMLAALKAGCAFAVIDPALPQQRREAMAEACAAAVVLTVGGPADPSPGFDLDELLARGPATPPPGVGVEVAYVMFTSGTTGEPAPVLGTHEPVAHFLDWQVRTFGLTPQDRFALVSGLSYDPVLRDVLTPLSSGAQLWIPPVEGGEDPHALSRWLTSSRITVLHLTPWQLRNLALATPRAALPDLRWVFCGGGSLTPDDVALVRRVAPHARCVSVYGTTETPQVMTWRVVDGTTDHRDVGVPIPGVQIEVVTRDGDPCSSGELGQIQVRSRHLSQGYLGRGGLTAERFVPDPWGGGGRVYRTGDRARRRADGAVEFLGRWDRQVKLRGHRVELGEVEAALLADAGVAQAVVVVAGVSGLDELVGYVVVSQPGAAGGLRERLGLRLPGFMVPSRVVVLARLPLSANGKVDRGALPVAGGGEPGVAHVAPSSPVEQVLAGIWAEVLGVSRVGVRDNFFAIGGHSLAATQVVVRAREALAVDVSVRDVFESPTLGALADAIVRRQLDEGGDAQLLELVEQLSEEQVAQRLHHLRAGEGGSTR